MQAVVCRRSGPPDVLQVEEIDRLAVSRDGILIRAKAASVNPADLFQLTPVARLSRVRAVETFWAPTLLGPSSRSATA